LQFLPPTAVELATAETAKPWAFGEVSMTGAPPTGATGAATGQTVVVGAVVSVEVGLQVGAVVVVVTGEVVTVETVVVELSEV